jgi:hypothetical protein
MANLIYDDDTLVDQQMYKYDKILHSRLMKYTGSGRTLVRYYNINEQNTTTSLGLGQHYQIIGRDSPLRYDMIEQMILLGFSPLQPEETQASSTQVRNYALHGEAYIIPGTIMPKENDFFVVNHLKMIHLFRVVQVTQDGLNTDGSYKINYELFSTNPKEINLLENQVVGKYQMDLQTIGGEDLTPIIGKEDYELRRRLILMINDMMEDYISRYYNSTHNCFLCNLNGRTLFDLCGNYFMAKHGVMMNDNAYNNIILNPNKTKDPRLENLYQKSPYKWIERDAPIRYLDTFKYHTMKGFNFPESSFALYGSDVDIMIPNDPWCASPSCADFFPRAVYDIFNNEQDIRQCHEDMCHNCTICQSCVNRHFRLQRFDYVSIIHDFIYGRLTDIHKLSLYSGDQLFDHADTEEIYLWTPIIIYIMKQTLKLK